MTVRDWTYVRDAIARDITDGPLAPGDQLPTESELVRRFGAGRHTIRRAVAKLARDGFVSIEQGRGTFVQPRPMLEYTIGPRTRMGPNMAAQGVDVTTERLGAESLPAPSRVAQALGLPDGAEVMATRSLVLADGLPTSFGTLFHDATRFAGFADRRRALGSVSAVYASYGIPDYLRGSTRMHARPARGEEPRLLRQHPDMPVIVVRAVDTEPDGTPIACSEVIWSAARVRFNIDTGGR